VGELTSDYIELKQTLGVYSVESYSVVVDRVDTSVENGSVEWSRVFELCLS